jgi:hypothetical protein
MRYNLNQKENPFLDCIDKALIRGRHVKVISYRDVLEA